MRSPAAAASPTGAAPSTTSAASASGTSSRTCTRRTDCMPPGWTSVYERDAVTTGLAPRRRRVRPPAGAVGAGLRADAVLRQPVALPRAARPSRVCTTSRRRSPTSSPCPQILFLVAAPLYLAADPGRPAASIAEYLAHAGPYLGVLVAFFVAMLGGRDALADVPEHGVRQPDHGGRDRPSTGRRPPWRRDAEDAGNGGCRGTSAGRSSPPSCCCRRSSSCVVRLPAGCLRRGRGMGGDQRLLARSAPWPPSRSGRQRSPLREDRAVVRRRCSASSASLRQPSRSPSASGSPNAPLADSRCTAPDRRRRGPRRRRSPRTEPVPLRRSRRRPAPVVPARSRCPRRYDRAAPSQRAQLAPPASGTYVGVSAEGMQSVADGVARWSDTHAGARPAIVNWFQHWGSGENRFREDWVQTVAAQGAVPMITWEPWAKPEGKYADPEQTGLPARADRRRHVRQVHHGVGSGGRRLWRPDPAAVHARVQRRLVPVVDRPAGTDRRAVRRGVAPRPRHLRASGGDERLVGLVGHRRPAGPAARLSRRRRRRLGRHDDVELGVAGVRRVVRLLGRCAPRSMPSSSPTASRSCCPRSATNGDAGGDVGGVVRGHVRHHRASTAARSAPSSCSTCRTTSGRTTG